MSSPLKKLKKKQYKLNSDRLEINNLVDRLTKKVQTNNQIFEDCGQIKIENPLDPKVFDRLMIMRLEELEYDKLELNKHLQKQSILNNTPNYCEI